MLNFILTENNLYNLSSNTDNTKYSTVVSGTSNLYNTLNAPIQMTKPHYYQLDPNYKQYMSQIVDSGKRTILPRYEQDEFQIGVEQRTGIAIKMRMRFLYNYEIHSSDPLYQNMINASFYYIPLARVDR